MSTPTLKRLDDEALIAGGGTAVYAVLVDDRQIGWVDDTRPRRSWRFGSQRWWACWREEGDTTARWTSQSNDDGFRSRAAAVAELLAVRAGV